MKTFDYTITDEIGIHARPAGLLVKEAKNFTSQMTISVEGKSVELTKLLAIMGLGVKQGMTVSITAEGEDEEAAITAMEHFFQTNL